MNISPHYLIFFSGLVTTVVAVVIGVRFATRSDRRRRRRNRARSAGSPIAAPVYFNWNGHSWDAYETLGISHESSDEVVKTAFEAATSCCEAESTPFIRTAYESICKQRHLEVKTGSK